MNLQAFGFIVIAAVAAGAAYEFWRLTDAAAVEDPHHTLRVAEVCNNPTTLRDDQLLKEYVDHPDGSLKPQPNNVENAECDVLKPGRVVYLLSERKPLAPVRIRIPGETQDFYIAEDAID